jgi:hypothetical protein
LSELLLFVVVVVVVEEEEKMCGCLCPNWDTVSDIALMIEGNHESPQDSWLTSWNLSFLKTERKSLVGFETVNPSSSNLSERT